MPERPLPLAERALQIDFDNADIEWVSSRTAGMATMVVKYDFPDEVRQADLAYLTALRTQEAARDRTQEGADRDSELGDQITRSTIE